MAVAATVPGVVAGGLRARGERRAKLFREGPLEDPVPASGLARLGEERAQRSVGEPIREEVEVVEDDQRAELDVGVHRPADRRQHSFGPELTQRGDVRSVEDVVRQTPVALPVARQVQDLDAIDLPARDEGGPVGEVTSSGAASPKPRSA